MHPLEQSLRRGSAALGLSLGEAQVRDLLAYLDMLAKWNRVYNLTAVRDPAQMLVLHLFDCLAVIPPLRRQAQAGRLLDVGSGGGLPGVVIAICCPDIDVTCVDAAQKKAAFTQQAAGTLKLPNLHAKHDRVEQLTACFDIITSRAFASLNDFVVASDQALAESGVWLAMKGKRPETEIAELSEAIRVFNVEPLTVPELGAERCIVWMRRVG